jgi:hypothetical protein
MLAGANVGGITRHQLGRNKRDFFRAEAIDGVELGFHATIAAAHAAILSDDAEGKPRDPTNARLRLPPGFAGR